MMFHRRHVYEHNGGVSTELYVRESGDKNAEAGLLITESAENVHNLISSLERMIEVIAADFDEMFPPEKFCINIENNRRKRRTAATPSADRHKPNR
jgi:hypothetical protein